MTATIGRIVHYVNEGLAIRPAIVVEDFGASEPGVAALAEPQVVNLQVFTDGENDNKHAGGPGLVWAPGVPHSQPDEGAPLEPNTWHWPRLVMLAALPVTGQ